LDHDGYLTSFAVMTDGKCHDVEVAYLLKLDPGTIIVDERGYNDYHRFAKWTGEGVFFVTRMKGNAIFTVIESRPVSPDSPVKKDEIILFTAEEAAEKCPYPMRRIEFTDTERGREFVFLTNHLDLGADTVAAIYKDRWSIELFFKALKQNLKIKTFVGTSPNAVKIQIWSALIAIKTMISRGKFLISGQFGRQRNSI
jgi:IS4 transposase